MQGRSDQAQGAENEQAEQDGGAGNGIHGGLLLFFQMIHARRRKPNCVCRWVAAQLHSENFSRFVYNVRFACPECCNPCSRNEEYIGTVKPQTWRVPQRAGGSADRREWRIPQ